MAQQRRGGSKPKDHSIEDRARELESLKGTLPQVAIAAAADSIYKANFKGPSNQLHKQLLLHHSCAGKGSSALDSDTDLSS